MILAAFGILVSTISSRQRDFDEQRQFAEAQQQDIVREKRSSILLYSNSAEKYTTANGKRMMSKRRLKQASVGLGVSFFVGPVLTVAACIIFILGGGAYWCHKQQKKKRGETAEVSSELTELNLVDDSSTPSRPALEPILPSRSSLVSLDDAITAAKKASPGGDDSPNNEQPAEEQPAASPKSQATAINKKRILV
jgi:hypothetical protein